jgi:hypothetical protein
MVLDNNIELGVQRIWRFNHVDLCNEVGTDNCGIGSTTT